MGPQVQEDGQGNLEQAGTLELLPDVLESYNTTTSTITTFDAFPSTFTKVCVCVLSFNYFRRD